MGSTLNAPWAPFFPKLLPVHFPSWFPTATFPTTSADHILILWMFTLHSSSYESSLSPPFFPPSFLSSLSSFFVFFHFFLSSLCIEGCSQILYAVNAGLKLLIFLLLSPKCEIIGTCHHCRRNSEAAYRSQPQRNPLHTIPANRDLLSWFLGANGEGGGYWRRLQQHSDFSTAPGVCAVDSTSNPQGQVG